jgi:hypothetical protein
MRLPLVIISLVTATTCTAAPLVDLGEFKDRERCLYREIDRLITQRGSTPTILHDIARTTAQFCSQAIVTRLRAGRPAREGEELTQYDLLQTELHAFAIGMDLKDQHGQ